jgi:hypothetical protein
MRPQRVSRVGLACFLAFAGPGAASRAIGAEASRVKVSLEAVGTRLPAGLRVVAVPQAYSAEPAGPLRVEQQGLVREKEAELQLEPGLWTVRAQGEGVWGASHDVFIEGADPSVATSVEIKLWPATTAYGKLRVPAGDVGPQSLTIDFQTAPAGSPPLAVPKSRETCSVAGTEWRCNVPAASLDLRLDAKGYVPHYFWDQNLLADKPHALGVVTLQRAASIVGWVKRADGRPAAGAVVEIRDANGESIPADARKPARPSARFAAAANARGFFQIVGVPAAEYLAMATLPGMVPDSRRVRLLKDAELRLLSALILAPPASLDVFIDPPVAPRGEPWSLDIMSKPGPGSTRTRRLVTDALVPSDGRWHGEKIGLAPGEYNFVVGVGEERWAFETLPVEPGQAVRLTVGLQRVRGKVKLGGSPLAARRVFGGDGSAEWPVLVEAEAPPVRRDLEYVLVERTSEEAVVEINLPATSLEGNLVDQRGAPVVTSSIVTVQQSKGEEIAQLITQPEDGGHFRFDGLPPGDYAVVAKGRGSTSEYVSAHLAESQREPVHVTLVLTDELTFTGRLLTPEGTPVPGALVKVVPMQNAFEPASTRPTDEAGRFAVQVSPETRELGICARAHGFAYKIARISLPPTKTPEFAVTLDRTAGRLVVAHPPASRDKGPYLVHGGYLEHMTFIQRWMAADDDGSGGEGETVLPQMEGGWYTACLLEQARLPLLLAGEAPKDACTSGFLPPGGELLLRLPSSAVGEQQAPRSQEAR